MKFTYDGITVDIGCAQFPYGDDVELVQVKERSASGVPYVENFNVQIDRRTYAFVDMLQEDYVRMMEFFLNTVNGIMNVFTVEDDIGDTFTARFDKPIKSFKLTSYRKWQGVFTLETVT